MPSNGEANRGGTDNESPLLLPLQPPDAEGGNCRAANESEVLTLLLLLRLLLLLMLLLLLPMLLLVMLLLLLSSWSEPS